MLHAYRKPEGSYFRCWPKDVCHEWDGDINPILQKPDLLGDFRSIFEPFWNLFVASILSGTSPEITLEWARSRHEFARDLLAHGLDPSALKVALGSGSSRQPCGSGKKHEVTRRR
jgi:hypothetical protein